MGIDLSFLPESNVASKLLSRLSNERAQRDGIDSGIRQALFFLAVKAVNEMKQNIKNPPKTGRIYVLSPKLARLARKKIQQASEAGKAPAERTGKLRRSTKWRVTGTGEVEFGYGEEYGKFLELGTSKMSMRPNLYPVGHRTARGSNNIFKREMQLALEAALTGK